MAYLGREAAGIIVSWIRVRGSQPGPLLCPIAQSSHVEIRPLSGQSLMLRLKERCRQAGIRPCSPHDLRRTYISYLLEDGADLAMAQRMADHANPRTTVRYDRREESANLPPSTAQGGGGITRNHATSFPGSDGLGADSALGFGQDVARIRKGAEAGDANAQHKLGSRYFEGWEFPLDQEEAEKRNTP